jgi:hypothetical protein
MRGASRWGMRLPALYRGEMSWSSSPSVAYVVVDSAIECHAADHMTPVGKARAICSF